MFVIPGIAALLILVYVRPQEVYELLRPVTFPIVVGVVALGYVLDVRTGNTRPQRLTLLVGASVAFFVWVLFTIAVRAPDRIGEDLVFFASPVALFLAASLGLQTLRGFWTMANLLLVTTLLLALVGIHQGLTPMVCIDVTDTSVASAISAPDFHVTAHPCEKRLDCLESGTVGRDYLCEHIGVLGTTSIAGRVRYRGIFQDPNELAWAMSMSLPFAFAWFERKKSLGRLLAAGATLLACIVCNIMTRSRSGQISLAATLGVYFVRRFGWKGAGIGGLLALPVLLLGGRSDESSTQERLECWADALDLWRENPFLGVGARQFREHNYLTAHNAFLLAVAELGPLGLVLWTLILYLAFKISIQVQQDFRARPEAQAARSAAFALMAGLVGLVASALFLSITYHLGLWIEVGLAGAIAAAVTRHDPSWRVRWRWWDAALVLGIDVVLLSGTALYLKLKGL